MSSTTLIFNPDAINDLMLKTKSRSYHFGRRLYTFTIDQQTYWLKFHEKGIYQELEQAFLHELDFYQQNVYHAPNLLLPHQIIQFHSATEQGQALVLIDSAKFFIDIATLKNIQIIKKKIEKALEPLELLHQLKWIHGDLKTEHFRLYQNSCRLIDFEQSFKQINSMQMMNATPHYMAPELFQGQAKSIQSDLYAFGIIVYEWLTQNRLTAKTYQDWAVLHCQQLEIQLPQALECFLPLLKGLLQKRIERRFQSVREVITSLNSINLL